MNKLSNILLLITSLLLSFMAAEWLARRLPAAERLGWNLVPSVNERIAHTPDKGSTRRIVVSGDSFAEWMEQSGGNFARISETLLQQRNQPVDFVNLGEAGSGISDYYRNLVTFGPDLKPDTVVIAVYLGNDLIPFPGGLPSPNHLADKLPPPDITGRQSIRAMLKQSILLNLLYRQAKAYFPWLQSGFTDMVVNYARSQAGKDETFVTNRLAEIDPELLRAAQTDAINGWDLATALFEPDYYQDLANADPKTKPGAAAQAALPDLQALCAFARTLTSDVRVVLIPPSPWVGTAYHDYFLGLGYRNLGPTDTEPEIIHLLKNALNRHHIPVLDLLPLLRASTQPAYLLRDIHFNAHGQQLAGEALAEFLAPTAP